MENMITKHAITNAKNLGNLKNNGKVAEIRKVVGEEEGMNALILSTFLEELICCVKLSTQ